MNALGLAHIMQVGLGFWPAKTLLSAIELELFTKLGEQSMSAEALRAALGLHPRSARDFFDTLVALGFLQQENGEYRNTSAAATFLDKCKPSYTGGLLEMANHRLYGFWGRLTEALRTGEPQNEVKDGGPHLFEALYAEPARLREFLKAMTGLSRGANLAIASRFPFDRYQSAADIGTAQGDLIVQVALAHPHIEGVGFDLPQVGPIFEDHVQAHSLAPRVKFLAGSFFETDLPKSDVLMMGHILHDWDLEQKMMLIRKAHEALPAGGAFIAYDSIIDDARKHNAFGLMMSLNMLIETPGGFDYTGADCCGWMKQAGFRETRVEHLVGPDSMVVGIK